MKRKRSNRDSASRAEPEVRIHLPPAVSPTNSKARPLCPVSPQKSQAGSGWVQDRQVFKFGSGSHEAEHGPLIVPGERQA
jgi:hypothetical protein